MLTIVVGGQFGGEGKGKICAYLGSQIPFTATCRGGGVNSSHTVIHAERHYRLRLVPTACVTSEVPIAVYGAGTLLHIRTLLEEIALVELDRGRIMIDPRAGIVLDKHVSAQRSDDRYGVIGSTLTGTGYANADRCRRQLLLAREFPELASFLLPVPPYLCGLLREGREVLVEGHQGFGLSNYHGDYPYCSSRDTTVAALLSELGLGPGWPMRVILAIKVFPTRNHGGRLDGELPRADVDRLGICEYGGGSWGVDDRRRRVGRLNLEDVAAAAEANSATEIALTGVDYLDPCMRGCQDPRMLTAPVRQVIKEIERLGQPVTYLSTGPETSAMIDLSGGAAKGTDRQTALLE